MRLQEAISLGLFLGVVHGLGQAAYSVPVVPNFTQGSMTSHTETTSKQTETINSIDYATGWQYSVSGTNVSADGNSLLPPSVTNSVNVNPLGGIEGQVQSSTVGLDFRNSNFTVTDPTKAFQFTQSYMGPGVTNQTVIQRTTEVTSVTDTTSIFTQ
tara:strand:+ start:362 stop:829 length:468 start_codon:yes stop_codon:yes gene_type:complete